MRAMTHALADYDEPTYVRMGRGAVDNVYSEEFCPFEIGKANVLTQGNDCAIFTSGETVNQGYKAAKLLELHGIKSRVIDVHTIKPLDTETIINAIKECKVVVSVDRKSVV